MVNLSNMKQNQTIKKVTVVFIAFLVGFLLLYTINDRTSLKGIKEPKSWTSECIQPGGQYNLGGCFGCPPHEERGFPISTNTEPNACASSEAELNGVQLVILNSVIGGLFFVGMYSVFSIVRKQIKKN